MEWPELTCISSIHDITELYTKFMMIFATYIVIFIIFVYITDKKVHPNMMSWDNENITDTLYKKTNK